MLRNDTTVRRIEPTAMLRAALTITLLAMLQLAPLPLVGSSDATATDPPVIAKMVRAEWQTPDAAHTIEPHGTITTMSRPTSVTTNLPPDEDLKGDLTMRIVVEFDTTKSNKAPIKFRQRSGMLTITPLPEDIKDDVIQPSAIDGNTAKVRIDVTADGVRLRFLKKVYYEQVNVGLPGQKKKQQTMQWTWKPSEQHDL